jgi:hypothetical protein
MARAFALGISRTTGRVISSIRGAVIASPLVCFDPWGKLRNYSVSA